ncbi:MAG: OmpH family outer membrane protein [Planctomycetes bacterium]|nr:OmpH family outer membrane protein [Planctomycetota bacterium]
MFHRKIWIPAALAACATVVAQQPPASQPLPGPAAPARQGVAVGVVDLDKAIEAYPKAIAERERLQALSKSFTERLDEAGKQIDQLRDDLKLLKEGSPQRDLREFEFTSAVKNREALASFLKAQFDRELERFELAIYQDLEVAVAEVAKLKGVQIVLRVRATPSAAEARDAATAQKQKLAVYDRRHVWFASPEVDLTPALVQYLQVPVEAKPPASKPVEAPKDAAGRTDGNARPGGGP